MLKSVIVADSIGDDLKLTEEHFSPPLALFMKLTRQKHILLLLCGISLTAITEASL